MIYNLSALFIVAYLVSVIGSLGGIGGSPILVPLYSFIMNTNIKEAVVMSIITGTGSTIIRALFFFHKKQKYAKNRYLANYELVRFLVTFNSNTAYIGYLLNQYLPNVAIFILFVLLLYVLIFLTAKKAWQSVKMCISHKKKSKLSVSIDGIDYSLPVTRFNINERVGETFSDIAKNILYNILTFGLIAFFTFIINDSEMPWLVYIIQFCLMSIYGFMTYHHIMLIYKYRKKISFNFLPGDVNWIKKGTAIELIIFSWIIGVLATMIGSGGGIIINPVLLAMNIPADSVIATGSMIAVFGSIISSVQYLIAGDYLGWHLTVLFGMGVAGGTTAMIIFYFFKKSIKTIIVIINLLLLIMSLILFMVYNALDMLENGIH